MRHVLEGEGGRETGRRTFEFLDPASESASEPARFPPLDGPPPLYIDQQPLALHLQPVRVLVRGLHVPFALVHDKGVPAREAGFGVDDEAEAVDRAVEFEFAEEVLLGHFAREPTDKEGLVRVAADLFVVLRRVCGTGVS